MININHYAYVVVFLISLLTLAGCGTAAHIATQVADSKQKPPITTLNSKANTNRVFTAAVQTMGTFGKILSQDRSSGIVQCQRGNWVFNTSITPANTGSKIELSGRYVPGSRMDFNSREEMTNEIIQGLEKKLDEKLILTQ